MHSLTKTFEEMDVPTKPHLGSARQIHLAHTARLAGEAFAFAEVETAGTDQGRALLWRPLFGALLFVLVASALYGAL
jgi:hypothetical protein